MAEGWRSFLKTWEGFRTEATGYRELDGERVLVLARFGGRGKTSGLELGRMRTNSAALFHCQNGKVTKLVIYWDGQRALSFPPRGVTRLLGRRTTRTLLLLGENDTA
jgi:hypothetical protein